MIGIDLTLRFKKKNRIVWHSTHMFNGDRDRFIWWFGSNFYSDITIWCVWWIFYSFDSFCFLIFRCVVSVRMRPVRFFIYWYTTYPFVVRMVYIKYVYLVFSPQLRICYPDAHIPFNSGSGRIFFYLCFTFVHSIIINVLFPFHPSSMHSWCSIKYSELRVPQKSHSAQFR